MKQNQLSRMLAQARLVRKKNGFRSDDRHPNGSQMTELHCCHLSGYSRCGPGMLQALACSAHSNKQQKTKGRLCLQNDRPKSSQNINLGRPQTPHFAQSPGVMVPLGPSSPVIATTSYPNIFQISILAWGDGSTGTIVLF